MGWPTGPTAASLPSSIPFREASMAKIQRIIVPGLRPPVSHSAYSLAITGAIMNPCPTNPQHRKNPGTPGGSPRIG